MTFLFNVGIVKENRNWWDILCLTGPSLGYFPNGKKSVLIVKSDYENEAPSLFEGTGVQITTEGQRYLGAPLGTVEFKNQYVTEQVKTWVQELSDLSELPRFPPRNPMPRFPRLSWGYRNDGFSS